MTTIREHRAAIRREIGRWRGAALRFGKTRRHQLAVVSYNGNELRYVFPTSASDHRGIQNSISHIRRVLREWGCSKRALGEQK